MNTKMTTVKKPRFTVAQQREAQALKKAELEAAFEADRAKLWSNLWINALRLHIILDELKEENSFNDKFYIDQFGCESLKVNAIEEYFHFRDYYANQKMTPESITLDSHNYIEAEFFGAFDAIERFHAEKERERLAEVERQLKRSTALAKLTKEDREALGIAG